MYTVGVNYHKCIESRVCCIGFHAINNMKYYCCWCIIFVSNNCGQRQGFISMVMLQMYSLSIVSKNCGQRQGFISMVMLQMLVPWNIVLAQLIFLVDLGT